MLRLWLDMRAGLAKLKCLSLRNSPSLQPDSLFALIQLPALQSLDLHALLHLTDDIGPIIAQLPSLRALNMGMTSVGNNFVRCLTRRLELDAWARSTGALPGSDARCSMAACGHSTLAGCGMHVPVKVTCVPFHGCDTTCVRDWRHRPGSGYGQALACPRWKLGQYVAMGRV